MHVDGKFTLYHEKPANKIVTGKFIKIQSFNDN